MQTFFTDLWNNLYEWIISQGVQVIIILVVAFIIQKIAGRGIERLVRKLVVAREGVSKEAEEKRENTLIRILGGTLKIILWIVVGMVILSELGVDIGPLIAGAGIIGLAVGFGGQYLVRDIVTGLFIILENQYRVGDAVEIGGIGGAVEDITLRVTILRDLDGVVHHIPHGNITNVSNKSMNYSRVNLNVGIGYAADVDKAANIIDTVGIELAEDVDWKDDIITAPRFLRVDDLADSAVILKIIGEVKPAKQWGVAGELRRRLKKAFDKEGIEIPFPQMVIHNEK